VAAELFKQFKDDLLSVLKSRVFILSFIFVALFGVLVGRLFYLQIVKGETYLSDFKLQIQKTQEIKSTRGNIYDRNGNLLAYNELAYSVTIEDNGAYDNLSDDGKNDALNANIQNVLSILDKNGDTSVSYFNIILDDSGNYEFSDAAGTSRNRFIADVYGEKSYANLTDDKKNATADDIMAYMCGSKKYHIDQDAVGKATALRIVNIRYAMTSISYSKYLVTTVAKDVSNETVAAVKENSDTLQGVDISEESLRRYTDAECFSSVIGYTGVISTDEYETLSQTNSNYSLNDVVGKAGIEQVMDAELQGTKGQKTFYVDSLGNVLQTTNETEPIVGNDLYLTIDKNLQEAVYKILEQKLAGIISSKLTNAMTYDPHSAAKTQNIEIPIGDVYTSFFTNMTLDISKFAEAGDNTTQYAVYQSFLTRQDQAVNSVVNELGSPSGTYSSQSEETQAYFTYIVGTLLESTTGILDTDKIDTTDATYKAWNDSGSISTRDFLNYAISKNWVDTSKLEGLLGDSSKYSDSDEIIQAIMTYLNTELRSDSKFSRIIYKYMVLDGTISGRQICLMLFEQGVLKEDDASIAALDAGSLDSYTFLASKINDLEITPAQLALEPCTASCVITDPSTGQVLACVSYPGYDSNRLSNTMDTAYYYKLVYDGSRPLYNNATQEKTAPGSTYKMVSAVAGLESGTITTSTYFNCTGEFTKITPSPKCWIYPSAHGSLNVTSAIAKSCNDFFFNVGYNLGLDSSGNYSSDRGLSVLAKYASDFGLDSTSGIELSETKPQISDSDSVRSAIGQGTNNYTVSQLARYVTAVANRGTVYNLSLLNKLEDPEGNVVQTYTPEVKSQMNVSSTTWDAVQQGMYNMAASSSAFTDITRKGFYIAGKTGTAQQSDIHPDHVLFVGYAPYDNPKIALCARIANGYVSSYTSEIADNIIKYYFNLEDSSSILNGTAASVGTASTGD